MKRLVYIGVLLFLIPVSAGAVNKGVFIGPGIYQIDISGSNGTLTGGEAGVLFYATETEFINIKGHFSKGTVDGTDLTQYTGKFVFGYLPINKPFYVGPIFGLEYLDRDLKDRIKWKKLFVTGGLTGYFKTVLKVRVDIDAVLKAPVYKKATVTSGGQSSYTPRENPSFELGLSLNYWKLSLRGFWQYEKEEKDPDRSHPPYETNTFGTTLTIHF